MSETPPPQAYISKVHLKGYKSIKDLEIDFKPGLNIIIGPNGSGKTNFLEFVYESQSSQTYETLTKEEFFSEISTNYMKVILEGKFSQFSRDALFYEVREKGFQGKELIQHRGINFDKTNGKVKIGFIKDDEANPQSLWGGASFKSFFSGVEFIRFSSNYQFDTGLAIDIFSTQRKEISAYPVDSPFELVQMFFKSINEIGELSSELKRKLSIDNQRLISNLRQFTPIKDLSVENDSILLQTMKDNQIQLRNIHLKFLVNDKWLYWNQLSDGTKRLFYILSKLTDDFQSFYFIEEPELGIHPDQLSDLMDFLKEQSQTKQIIITTHSPEVMNILNKDELDRIIVTRFDKEKGTQMHKLSPHKIKKGQIYMKKVGHLSDFWVHSNLEEIDEED